MSTSNPDSEAISVDIELPWYRQFWPWMLIALPSITVIAGIVTIIIAVNNSDSLVKDNYYKEGLAINVSQGQEHRALELGIGVTLIATELNTLEVRVTSPTPLTSKKIRLELTHPTQEKKDRQWDLDLNQQQSALITQLDLNGPRWYVRVSEPNNEWHLVGTWLTNQKLELGTKP